MKRWLILMVILGMVGLVAGGIAFKLLKRDAPTIATQKATLLKLSGARSIQAGESWTLTIELDTTQTKVDLLLLNGLVWHHATLTTDESSTTTWEFPKDTLIYAGTSLVIARSEALEEQFSLEVKPLPQSQLEAITTANHLPAYGEGQSLLISLLADRWGNPLRADETLVWEINYPDGTVNTLTPQTTWGIAWAWLISQGRAGRVRISLDGNGLDIQQVPLGAAQITLTINPPCLLNDGRDLVTLIAQVADAYGEPVADGSLITFLWESGQGYAPTIGGIATLTLPTPTDARTHFYTAESESTLSTPQALLVSAEGCLP